MKKQCLLCDPDPITGRHEFHCVSKEALQERGFYPIHKPPATPQEILKDPIRSGFNDFAKKHPDLFCLSDIQHGSNSSGYK